jgi:hypothetical protein
MLYLNVVPFTFENWIYERQEHLRTKDTSAIYFVHTELLNEELNYMKGY